MKFFLCATVFLFLLTLTGFAQTPTPIGTPTSNPVDDNEDVVKISTTLIQIDVIVTDNDGKVVRDLKTEDFEIFENDEKQNITNFLFVPSESKTTTSATPKNDLIGKINVPVPSAQLRPEQVKRTIALIVDDLGLSFESVDAVRRSLRKFVDEQMQPNDLAAVIQTSSKTGILQQFTSDRRQLYTTIENLRWNPSGRGGVSVFTPSQTTLDEQMVATEEGDVEYLKKRIEVQKNQTDRYNDFQQDIFTGGTLGAINYVVKEMGGLPGRKSIMLLSDGFQICPAVNRDRCDRMLLSLKRLTDLANRASVSIYSFDARGLQDAGFSAADSLKYKTKSQLDQLGADRAEEIYDKQEGLAYLSKETGGRSFFNSNDINKNLTKALDDQKDYYLIGYQPQAESFDPKTRRFNTLRVKVNRKDVNVRYRSGFFGIEDSDIRASNLSAGEQMAKALTSPFPVDDINIRFNALFGSESKFGVLSLMYMNVKDLKFTDEQNGEKTAVFDFLAMSFGENGKLVERVSGNYTLSIKKEVYEKVLNEGFVYNFIFPVKKSGAYHIKAAVRDTATGKIGSASQFIEIPNLKKKNLILSGIVLENFTMQQWRQPDSPNSLSEASVGKTNPLLDTSLRRFKRGTVLRYGVEIYNAKAGNGQKPQLTTYIRLFYNGKTVLNSNELPIELLEQTDFQKINSMNAIKLGPGMASGDYILQLIVVDNMAKEKNKVATQSVQFEIVN